MMHSLRHISGNLTTDAHLAALTLEHGATLCSTDADFGRFVGLKWENPVAGVVGEYLPFGENASVTLWVNGRRDVELRFAVPTHVGTRNGLAPGVAARVSLLRDALHLMPYEPLERLAAGAGEGPSVDPARARG